MNVPASVIILSQPAEAFVTALTLHHLIRDLDTSVTVHVLVNGGFAGELRMMAPGSPQVHYHESPSNLGVAGGRNFLLRLPDVQESDVIVILDNDVISPPGHVERLVSALAKDPRAGVIGPAVLHLPAVEAALGLKSETARREPITNERLTGLGRLLREQSSWFHLGTHPDWRAVYIDEVQLEHRLIGRAGGDVAAFPSMNHEDSRIRAAVADRSVDPIPASNVAGCCQVFRRDLIDELGYLTDEFSPYGYEDVDFCIRALRAGRRNYVDPTIVMLHGTDGRHAERRTSEGRIATQRNFMRCKALLAWQHERPRWETVVENSILRRYLVGRQVGGHRTATEFLRAHVCGHLDACRQLGHVRATHQPDAVR